MLFFDIELITELRMQEIERNARNAWKYYVPHKRGNGFLKVSKENSHTAVCNPTGVCVV